MRGHVQCLLAALLVAEIAAATTISVRKDGTGDYAILQEALNVAADGDTIRLGPGAFTEMSWVRLPGWSWDIQSCGYVSADDVTIIGEGMDQTLIGAPTYSGTTSTFSPNALVYVGGESLSIRGLTVRNCYAGIYVIGTLAMDHCTADNNSIGVFWPATGAGGWLRDSVIRSSLPLSPIGLRVESSGGGSGILMERCRSEGVETTIVGIDGMTIVDCDFTDEIVGISIYGNASVYIHGSTVSNMTRYGIMFSLGAGGYCEIHDSEVSGGYSALDSGGNSSYGRFIVYGSRLQGGSVAVLSPRYRPRAWLIMGCDLVRGSGPTVQCGPSSATVTHDMRNNYWGTTSEADIQSWIVDHNDNANIPATVLYAPFDGQPAPTESTTWGDLKALFR